MNKQKNKEYNRISILRRGWKRPILASSEITYPTMYYAVQLCTRLIMYLKNVPPPAPTRRHSAFVENKDKNKDNSA